MTAFVIWRGIRAVRLDSWPAHPLLLEVSTEEKILRCYQALVNLNCSLFLSLESLESVSRRWQLAVAWVGGAFCSVRTWTASLR